MVNNHSLGARAEQYAAEYLEGKGYEIIGRNYRCGKSEIDIIATHMELLVVVEVKARSTAYFGMPQEFIGKVKIGHIVKAADHYMQVNNLDGEVRFDVIAIVERNQNLEVTHIEDAFYHF